MKAYRRSSALKFRFAGTCLFIILMGMFSCKKSPGPNSGQGNYFTQPLIVNETGPVNIYLAGWRSAYPDFEFATFWKNSQISDLTSGVAYITANSIAVSGSNVYIGGNDFVNNHHVAKYWKNGTLGNLADPAIDSYVSSVAVSGNDVYFAGYASNGSHKVATCWKNGVAAYLTSGSTDA